MSRLPARQRLNCGRDLSREPVHGPAERGRDRLSWLGLLAQVGIACGYQLPRPVGHLPVCNELGVGIGSVSKR